MSNNKRRSTRSTSSHHSFSHSRKYLNPPNDNVQRRVSVVSSSSSRHYIRTNDIVIQQPSTTSEIVSECAVCMVEKSVDKFKGIYEKSCVHVERTVCNSCVYEHIKVLLENSMFDLEDIACPEPNCPGRFSYQTIQLILVVIGENTELFKRYDQHLTNLHLSRMPGFVWCAYGCGSGHLHYFLPKLDPVVICMKCDQRTCFNHRVIWHTNMACDQYDLSQIQSAESDANHKWLELFAKQCPKCQWHIEKNEGCDHMTCRYCEHEFCWQCLADYEPIAAYGNSEHDTSCIYYETY